MLSPVPTSVNHASEGYSAAQRTAIVEELQTILHSPAYAEENAGALRQDWPRVPLPPDAGILTHGAELGRRVAALLDPETPVPGVTEGDIPAHLRAIAAFDWDGDANPQEANEDLALKGNWGYRNPAGAVMPGGGIVFRHEAKPNTLIEDSPSAPDVRQVAPGTVTVVLNSHGRWTGIPEEVWNYTLGGYPKVLKKWLSYRERKVLGRPMKLAEIREFSAIARRIRSLLAMGPDLDVHYRASAEEPIR